MIGISQKVISGGAQGQCKFLCCNLTLGTHWQKSLWPLTECHEGNFYIMTGGETLRGREAMFEPLSMSWDLQIDNFDWLWETPLGCFRVSVIIWNKSFLVALYHSDVTLPGYTARPSEAKVRVQRDYPCHSHSLEQRERNACMKLACLCSCRALCYHAVWDRSLGNGTSQTVVPSHVN